jgi:hypothetical protein
MKKLSIAVKVVICLGFAFLAIYCSATKKIQAANILQKCKFSFQKAQLDSFTGDSIKFSIFLDAHNQGEDSLLVQNLIGTVYLDSIFEIPLSLKNSKWISPGHNQVSFLGAWQLDLFKMLALPNVKKFRMKGKAFIALKPEQQSTEIDFDETRDVPPDLVAKMLKKLIGL